MESTGKVHGFIYDRAGVSGAIIGKAFYEKNNYSRLSRGFDAPQWLIKT